MRFKSGEKGLYKELNGDVGIKFPIKVDIAQNPHKVSLLVQSELGGSIFPNHDRWKKHKTQFNIDKNMVFSHVNRLIRCIIDCQLHLDDAVSARNSLELARSLAARVWDSSPFQMKQIDGIGDVGVRKLVQAGVNSIETLQNTEPYRIESALGRNPPFGQKVLAKAMEFPSLHVSVREMGKERRPGHWVKIKFKADVGFVNEKVPIFFRRKQVYVCFLAETSDGQLIDFRRFAAKKLENGQEIFLSVQLVRPTASISCHIMCDGVAGTSRRAEMKLEHFPASYFPTQDSLESQLVQTDPVVKAGSEIAPDFEDYGDLDDADLIAALDKQEGIEVIHDIDKIVLDNQKRPNKSAKRHADKISTDHDSDNVSYKEPIQLANGNWTCQHTCKERGKMCKHQCCFEGVKNPAKPGRKKSTKKDASKQGSFSDPCSKPSVKPSPFEKARFQAEVKKQKSAVTTTQKADKPEPFPESTGVELDVTVHTLSKTPAHQYEKGQVPKLSFMQDSWDMSNVTEESVETRAELGSPYTVTKERPPMKYEGKDDPFSIDDSDIDIDVGTDIFVVEKSIYTTETKPRVSMLSTCGSEERPDNHLELFDSPRSVDSREDQFLESQTSTGNPSYASGKAQSVECSLQSRNKDSSDDSFDHEADLGGFHAPLAHITLSAIQKCPPSNFAPSNLQLPATGEKESGLLITGESSSPERRLQMHHAAVKEVEEYGDAAIEAFFATLEAADYDAGDPPAKKQKLDRDTQVLMLSAENLPDLQSSSTRTSSSLAELEVPRQPLTTLHSSKHQQSKPKQAVTVALVATEEELKQKLAEEEQRKKWEGYEDFYEEFGEYVEIV